MKGRAYRRIRVELRIQESNGLSEALIEQCDQSRPKRRHGARPANDRVLAIHAGFVAGVVVCVPRDVRDAATDFAF
jgi:hypothetical protein